MDICRQDSVNIYFNDLIRTLESQELCFRFDERDLKLNQDLKLLKFDIDNSASQIESRLNDSFTSHKLENLHEIKRLDSLNQGLEEKLANLNLELRDSKEQSICSFEFLDKNISKISDDILANNELRDVDVVWRCIYDLIDQIEVEYISEKTALVKSSVESSFNAIDVKLCAVIDDNSSNICALRNSVNELSEKVSIDMY